MHAASHSGEHRVVSATSIFLPVAVLSVLPVIHWLLGSHNTLISFAPLSHGV